MWNANLKAGTVWSVKSLNEHDSSYLGMTYGISYVLILSVFEDEYGNKKFTYCRVNYYNKSSVLTLQSNIGNQLIYIDLEHLYTGDQRALDSYIGTLTVREYNGLLKCLRDYFNLNYEKKNKLSESQTHINKKPVKSKLDKGVQLHKYGMVVIVVPNDDVHIDDRNRIILSDKAKYDILNNTDCYQDVVDISNKYQIYPDSAITVIKSKLKYQAKNHK